MSRDRPRWLKGFRQVKAPDFLDFRHYEGGKVIILTHQPSLPPGVSWYSLLEAESTPGHVVPSAAREKKSTVTPLGIDPETLRLAAQCLNHYATPGPSCLQKHQTKTTEDKCIHVV
jgi:hypothetical protein